MPADTAPTPTSARLFAVPLEPLLSRDNPRLYLADGSTPKRTYPTGIVANVFFDNSRSWLQAEIASGRLDAVDIPPTAEVSGGHVGVRTWTLPDVEAIAFALFHNPKKPSYDAAALLRTLDVVYAVARLQGLLPPN